MMNATANARLDELMSDESFFEKVKNANTLEDVLGILHTEGVDMEMEELHDYMEEARNLLTEKGYLIDGELSEEALDLVAGGRNWKMIVGGFIIGGVSGYFGCGQGVALGVGLILLGWFS